MAAYKGPRTVDSLRFIFWEAMKALSLVFLAVLAAKGIGGLRADAQAAQSRRLARRLGGSRGVLYALLLALAAFGARGVGYDLAAQFYFWASQDNLAHSDAPRANANALRAVQLRPGELRYWQTLARSKFSGQQFASMLEDEPAFKSLRG